jgi:hypothetical protein
MYEKTVTASGLLKRVLVSADNGDVDKRVRLARRSLQGMGEHMLNDIGLGQMR